MKLFDKSDKDELILTSTVLVQEPDYIGFRKINMPVRALGAVYDGLDPYAEPRGVILLVADEDLPREVFVARERREQNGVVVYRHDLDLARYVAERNGFEEAQLRLEGRPPSPAARAFLRAFLEAQNNPAANIKYRIEVAG
ncbi:MAG TPA: hypothetical protein VMV79_05985 [Alphaproteobacteria bacterium]|nr:hypothetical protein [Alphaproteobacteria bacterium]